MKLEHENTMLRERIELLQQQIEIRSTALNMSDIMIRITDLQGKILYINSAHATLLGYSEEDRIGFSTFDVIHPEDRQRVIDFFFSRQALIPYAKGESPPIEYRMRHKDGHYLWARAVGKLAEERPDLIVMTVWDITESKQMEDQLHALAEKLHAIREEERTLISREIHDEFGQALTGLKFELALLSKKISQDNVTALQKARGMMQSIDETIQLIRRISTDLRPPILDDFGLKAAVEWLAEDFEKKNGIRSFFKSNYSGEIPIEKEKAISIFRIFQEALTNVTRHAGASQITIAFHCLNNALSIQIDDNGVGIVRGKSYNRESLGIMEMKERAFALNGTFKIGAAPGRGTRIELHVPLP